MDYVSLGRSGLKVSPLCLGTMNFGPHTTEANSFKIMDKALDLGINFFDTANVYGWEMGEGITEKIIGRWIAQGGGHFLLNPRPACIHARTGRILKCTQSANSLASPASSGSCRSTSLRAAGCDAR